MMGLVPLKGEDKKGISLSHMRKEWDDCLQTRKSAHIETKCADILDLPASETVRNFCCLNHVTYGI